MAPFIHLCLDSRQSSESKKGKEEHQGEGKKEFSHPLCDIEPDPPEGIRNLSNQSSQQHPLPPAQERYLLGYQNRILQLQNWLPTTGFYLSHPQEPANMTDKQVIIITERSGIKSCWRCPWHLCEM
ncbi:hypothetical protein CDAR_5961 [Caerostris darwini]|uniref:Uncharacterized protein n=1 Tax=Caerostris darwini TaxID=1538125 RepID=A0AAV4MKC6_9ARAC|nr:hypothetical protein CDAR_5961 [Caerostris darwini]